MHIIDRLVYIIDRLVSRKLVALLAALGAASLTLLLGVRWGADVEVQRTLAQGWMLLVGGGVLGYLGVQGWVDAKTPGGHTRAGTGAAPPAAEPPKGTVTE